MVQTGSESKPDLESYLEVVREFYEACIDHIDHNLSIPNVDATLRFHFVKFDSNGTPLFDDLASALMQHIIYYCISSRKRPSLLQPHESAQFFTEARDMFRKIDTSGELGELLLYFLQEAVLEAPQVLCKMELKTNPGDEVKGADGIHIKWDSGSRLLNIYIGESKLYSEFSTAISSITTSIKKLYDEKRLDDELRLATTHFKHVDGEAKSIICDYMDRKQVRSSCRIVHSCLVGFDWSKYKALSTPGHQEFVRTFEGAYLEKATAIAEKTTELFSSFEHSHLTYEFFFIPFKSVQEFRDEFYRSLTGKKK